MLPIMVVVVLMILIHFIIKHQQVPQVDLQKSRIQSRWKGRCFECRRVDKDSVFVLLPLQRVERVFVELIRNGDDVTRGTLLATLESQTYDELVRLGLPEEKENLFRSKYPDAEGALIFKKVLPNGPLDGKIRVGDILISINETVSNQFAEIESILDESVGKESTIVVDRQGKSISQKITVSDLHEVTPDEYADICGGVFTILVIRLHVSTNCHLMVFLSRTQDTVLNRGI